MIWFFDIFQAFSPVFQNYVRPFIGLGIIIYAIYLIQFAIWGGNKE